MIQSKKQVNITFVTILILMLASINVQSASTKIDAAEQAIVIAKLSSLLNEKYVFPEVAEKSTDFIQEQLAAGVYQEINDSVKFGQKLTLDLQSVSHDKHMYVSVITPFKRKQEQLDPETAQLQRRRIEKEENYGFKKVDILTDNVGYIRFDYFSGHNSATSTAAAALLFLSNSDAIIIDLRNNIGGSSEMFSFFISYFFEQRTLLEKIYRRENNINEEFWTLNELPGKRLDKIPLYVLTSKKTASAGEALAFHLQIHQRATIIGETTAGAANRGDFYGINKNYNVFISTANSVSSVSGASFGGVGIIPDIKISAELALTKAYTVARKAARNNAETKFNNKLLDLKNATTVFMKAHQMLTFEEAEQLIVTTLDVLVKKWDIDESAINDMAYRFLQHQQNPNIASVIFLYNVKSYPQSYNVYSSLADSYVALGEIQLATENYAKALKLEPDDSYSQEKLNSLSK